MKAIGERSFGTGDVPALLQRARTDKRYLFKSRDELIARSQAALARAKAAHATTGSACCRRPTSSSSRIRSSGRRTGRTNTTRRPRTAAARRCSSSTPTRRRRRAGVEAESTAFHETIPGHHLQGAIALERKDIHPIGRYLGNARLRGRVGAVRRTARRRDEAVLGRSRSARHAVAAGAARRRGWSSTPGMHTLGWTRQQAIDYMLAHTAEDPADVASEVDRYIIYPGPGDGLHARASSRSARRARRRSRRWGRRFDIKQFHDRVLEDGAIPVSFLHDKITAMGRDAMTALDGRSQRRGLEVASAHAPSSPMLAVPASRGGRPSAAGGTA